MVKVLRSFVRGPLEPHVAGFAEELLRQGYTRSSAEQHVCFIAHLDRWMSAEGVGRWRAERAGDRAVSGRATGGGVCGVPVGEGDAAAAGLPRAAGRAAGPAEVPPGPVEELLGRYRDYLLGERGLTAGTARGYVDCVRPFVATRAARRRARSGRDRRRPMSPGSCWPPARAGRSGRRS